MSMGYSIKLYRPRLAPASTPAPETAGVPQRVSGGASILSFALAVADALGADFQDALDLMNNVETRPRADDTNPVYTEDDAEVLALFLERLLPEVDRVVDPEGRPNGTTAGEALRQSPDLDAYDDGRLVFRRYRLPFDDWRYYAGQLAQMARYAADHGLWLSGN
jgi:hypothetical protein